MGREQAGRQLSCGIAVPVLANGTVPFEQPDLACVPYLSRVWEKLPGQFLREFWRDFCLTRDRDKGLAIS
jgi:hypothetical protein